MATGLCYSECFLEHDTGPGHPERPDRLRAVVRGLRQAGLWDDLAHLPFEPAARESIERLHEASYIDRVFGSSRQGARFIDTPDSAICPASASTAQRAVGAAIAAVDAVMRGEVTNAFCALRPPGHHAERNRSMGFCLFNNIALAAEHLVVEHQLSRIAIFDFDVHHGNGTQHLFEHRSDVLVISMHEDPRYLYPGTGFEHERGLGDGEGFTLNIEVPPGSGDAEYLRAMDEKVISRLEEYEPQFVLISAGFDAAASDPLAHMEVTSDGFEQITKSITDLAKHTCKGRIVSTLEGGYDLDALATGVQAHVRALADH